MNTRFGFLSAIVVILISACGGSDSASDASKEVAKDWSTGDVDPYGCPFIEPEPWTNLVEHQEACGDGCTPASANGDMFVACVGDEVPRLDPDTGAASALVCLTNPIDDEDYLFADTSAAWPIMHLCWSRCGEVGPIPPAPDAMPPFEPPSECFELDR